MISRLKTLARQVLVRVNNYFPEYAEPRAYDSEHSAPGDAIVEFDPSRLSVGDGAHTIRLALGNGDANLFYSDAREARVLAARLLRAADEDDAARETIH